MRYYELNRLREPENQFNFHVKYNSNNILEVTQKLYLVAHKIDLYHQCSEKWYEPFTQNTGLLQWESANMNVCDIRRGENTVVHMLQLTFVKNLTNPQLYNYDSGRSVNYFPCLHFINISMFQSNILSIASFIGIHNKLFVNFKLRIYKNEYKIIYIYVYILYLNKFETIIKKQTM